MRAPAADRALPDPRGARAGACARSARPRASGVELELRSPGAGAGAHACPALRGRDRAAVVARRRRPGRAGLARRRLPRRPRRAVRRPGDAARCGGRGLVRAPHGAAHAAGRGRGAAAGTRQRRRGDAFGAAGGAPDVPRAGDRITTAAAAARLAARAAGHDRGAWRGGLAVARARALRGGARRPAGALPRAPHHARQRGPVLVERDHRLVARPARPRRRASARCSSPCCTAGCSGS